VIPRTRSGRAELRKLTDEEAFALCEGDVVLVEFPVRRSLAPVVVSRVREGAAYDAADQPYAVPVIEGWLWGLIEPGEPPDIWAVPECLVPTEDPAPAPAPPESAPVPSHP
jgi:hypothetical protein